MGGAVWGRYRENVPYLLGCGERGELKGETKRGVFCGDGKGDSVSALAL
jgi:hypothetical protein